ncbi:glucosyltransferase domain-containing protein [Sodalis sp. dw_96]|uniref:glucosyltransferase domain-containing protein n=1 Tax=Sodalis sp. dw_96 TaxID=2719794 RepID=UPI001BD5BA9C|nr:glucosyltransferase domain-containing protein [Sodalis sp. dw_96]
MGIHTGHSFINVEIPVKERYVYLLYLLIIVVSLSPILFSDYAFSDDYTTLYNILVGHHDAVQWDMLSGRPAFALLRYLGQETVFNIDGFSRLRWISVIFTSLYCCFLRFFLQSRKIFATPLITFFMPLSLSLVPSVVVYSAWATCFPFPLSLLLSGLAYHTLTHEKLVLGLRLLFGILLLILAFAIYQPTAMTFMLFVFFDNCVKKGSLSFKKLILSLITLAVGMLACLLMAKALPMALYHHTLDRSAFTRDITGKLAWFWKEPLLNAVSNYNINPVLGWTFFSVLILLAGLVKLTSSKQGLLKILLALMLAVGSFAPNLVVAESWGAFRSLVALESIVCAVFVMGVFAVVSFLDQDLRRTVVTALFAILVIATQNNLYSYFIRPQQAEYQTLAFALASKVDKNYTGEVMFDITDTAWNAFAPLSRYDEYGNISLATPWAPQGMALSLQRAKGYHFTMRDNVIVTPSNACRDNCIVIKTSDFMRDGMTKE